MRNLLRRRIFALPRFTVLFIDMPRREWTYLKLAAVQTTRAA